MFHAYSGQRLRHTMACIGKTIYRHWRLSQGESVRNEVDTTDT